MEYNKKCISSRFLKRTYPTFKQPYRVTQLMWRNAHSIFVFCEAMLSSLKQSWHLICNQNEVNFVWSRSIYCCNRSAPCLLLIWLGGHVCVGESVRESVTFCNFNCIIKNMWNIQFFVSLNSNKVSMGIPAFKENLKPHLESVSLQWFTLYFQFKVSVVAGLNGWKKYEKTVEETLKVYRQKKRK